MKNITEMLRAYQAEHHAISEIAKLSDAVEEVVSVFRHGRQFSGEPLPWRKTEELFRFRPRELTIWAGFNSHGKSLVLSDVMAHSVSRNSTKWAVASMEMPLARLAERFVMQCAVSQRPTERFIRECLDWANDKIYVFDELDSVEPDRMLAFAQMAFDKIKVDHVVIDSLVKCGVDSEHNEPQKRFVNDLQRVTKHHGGHTHLVHHLRKAQDEETIPNKQSLKGAGEIADLADNVLIVHRNKRKERLSADPDQAEKIADEPDARIIVEKQRHFDWQGSIRLWFNHNGLRYTSSPTETPKLLGPVEDFIGGKKDAVCEFLSMQK